jgi:hypothetical protein
MKRTLSDESAASKRAALAPANPMPEEKTALMPLLADIILTGS